MPPFNLVIFDCDGVIVDSEPLAAEIISAMAAESGLSISPDEAQLRFNGRKVAIWIKELEADAGQPMPENFIPEFRRRCADLFREKLQPVPGIKEVLESLPLPYCMASSGPLEKINVTLGKTDMLPFFSERIFSGYEVGCWKPDPGLFLHAAAAFQAAPETCAVVEDSAAGVEAGLRAGMTVFHYQPLAEPLTDPQQKLIRFQSMSQLPQLLQTPFP